MLYTIDMKTAAGVLSAALLVGFGGVVVVSVMTGGEERALAEHIRDFDMEAGPAPAPAPAAPAEAVAPAAPSDPAEMMAMRDAPAERPAPAISPLLQETLKKAAPPAAADPGAWVRKHSLFQSLMAGPAKFMVNNTHFGAPRKLLAFLSDPTRMNRYLNHRFIRGALDNPSVVKNMLATPAMAKAFVESPAMRDPALVRALLKSGLVDRLAKSPGVKAALGDSAFTEKVMMQPEVMSWLTKNPDAAKLMVRLGMSAGGLEKYAPR